MQDTKHSRRRTSRRPSGEDDIRVLEDRNEGSSEWTLDSDQAKKHRSHKPSSASKHRSGRSSERSLSRSTHSKRHLTKESKKRRKSHTRSSSADDVRLFEERNQPAGAWSLSLDQKDEKRSSSQKSHSKRREHDSLEHSSHHHKRKTKKKTRSLSVHDTPLSTMDEATDAWPLLSLNNNETGKGGVICSLDDSIQESVKSSGSSRRGGGRRKHKEKSIPVYSSPTEGVVTDAAKPFMAKTVNEEAEAQRERLRDLEVQNNQFQEQMQSAMVKRNKAKNDGQETTSRGGRKITLCKVIGVAGIYLAGVATGYLISEFRQRKASTQTKEVYVTQSPTAVVLPSNYPTTAPTEFSYDDPAPEDCFAIEAKEEVDGQDGMITRSYDVHFDVQLKDSSTDWYGQLGEGVADKVIPDLACCKGAPTGQRHLVKDLAPRIEFSIRGHNRLLRNIRCVVANGSTMGLGENGDSCVELTGLCLPAVVTLDLTLKGDEADGDIMDLVRNVIQGDGSEPLVEKFDLERNVFSVVKLVDVVEHVPTQAPMLSSPATSRPTFAPTTSRPTSAPAVGPTTNAPTRAATQSPGTESPTTGRATQKPTSGGTPSQPTPAVTQRPTPGPSTQPSSKLSPGPTDSPSSSPTLVPTILASSSPTASPTTSTPSLTPSAAPTGRREVLEAILTPVVGTIDTAALDWLADTDTWGPPATETDPDSAWLERYSMVRFYFATNGASWADKGGWMTSTSVCDWSPETCDGNNRVREIDQGNNGLSGTLPTEVGLFPNLDTIKINDNGISGALPTEIGLPNLRVLNVDSNDFSGTIPSELGLTAMAELELSNNGLTGSIPPQLLSLSSVTRFDVKENLLTGTISSELGAMTEVLFLDFSFNSLSGSIPSEIGLLTKLKYFNLKFCDFTGLIPSELGLLNTLTHIFLDENDLSGSIPTTFFQLTKLMAVALGQNNRLGGTIPTELGLLTALTKIEINKNGLSGTIPSELNLLTNLVILRGMNTGISGPIPDLSALVNLEILFFGVNGLTGSIPPGMFNNMVALEYIDLSNNNLTGAIPAVPNPSLLTTCLYNDNCFSDLTNAGTCDVTNNCV